MKSQFHKYDVADQIKTKEDIVNYLEACFEEAGDDASFIAAALGDVVRAHGMAELGEATGLTREELSRSFSKDGNPSFGTVLKVMKALGLKLKPEAA